MGNGEVISKPRPNDTLYLPFFLMGFYFRNMHYLHQGCTAAHVMCLNRSIASVTLMRSSPGEGSYCGPRDWQADSLEDFPSIDWTYSDRRAAELQ